MLEGQGAAIQNGIRTVAPMDNYFYYIHNEKHSPKSCVVNFDMQMSSSQSGEWTMFFTREKNDTSNQNRERCFFTCEKNDTFNHKPQRCVSFAQKFPSFLAACWAPLRTHLRRKVFLKEFFLIKKVKNILEMEWNSFICFTVDKETAESRRNNSGRGKTKQDVSFCCAFSWMNIPCQLTGFPRMKNIQYLEAMKHKKGWSKKKTTTQCHIHLYKLTNFRWSFNNLWALNATYTLLTQTTVCYWWLTR